MLLRDLVYAIACLDLENVLLGNTSKLKVSYRSNRDIYFQRA